MILGLYLASILSVNFTTTGLLITGGGLSVYKESLK